VRVVGGLFRCVTFCVRFGTLLDLSQLGIVFHDPEHGHFVGLLISEL